MIKLQARDGRLYIAQEDIHDPAMREYFAPDHFSPQGGSLIMVNYGMDSDTIPWPFEIGRYWTSLEKITKALAHALYDDRETGVLPPRAQCVLLPDGMAFDIDHETVYCPDCDRDFGDGHREGCINEP